MAAASLLLIPLGSLTARHRWARYGHAFSGTELLARAQGIDEMADLGQDTDVDSLNLSHRIAAEAHGHNLSTAMATVARRWIFGEAKLSSGVHVWFHLHVILQVRGRIEPTCFCR